jgi:hypothetical protein
MIFFQRSVRCSEIGQLTACGVASFERLSVVFLCALECALQCLDDARRLSIELLASKYVCGALGLEISNERLEAILRRLLRAPCPFYFSPVYHLRQSSHL